VYYPDVAIAKLFFNYCFNKGNPLHLNAAATLLYCICREAKSRSIGPSALWSPGISLNNRASFNPVFNGMQPQLYTINLTSVGGCVTVDTQLVRTIKKIEIYVPTAFTPNNNGRNDYLHPILRAIVEVEYFRIFNRRGQLLYETITESPGWNG